jgi:glycosyltransferase involved in cell wall biosynthesis
VDWTNVARQSYKSSLWRLGLSGQARVVTNSQLLQEHYRNIALPPPSLVSLPIAWGELPIKSDPHRDETRILFLGGTRPEKGSKLIAISLLDMVDTFQQCKFIVHIPSDKRSNENDAKHFASLGRRVSILQGYIVRREYLTLLCQADCVVLPYDPDRYRLRTSGILIEALGFGVPVITTAGSWMASVVDRYGLPPLFMDKYESSALMSTLGRFLKDKEHYKTSYAQVAEEFRATHNPKKFMEQIGL